ncbi:MAG TPA: caspase family protein [Thermoanaerobaculia bacterium]|nr:caspase family protein [Thermoanaerobaculia bacterium]
MKLRTAVAVMTGALSLAIHAAPSRRAVLVGINDYTASAIKARPGNAAPGRDWPNLFGAVNDVEILREMLVLLYGFQERDVIVLTDQKATRPAILQAIHQQLVANAAKDDVLFFYYAGHGSQVRNSRSDERDGLDESIVPADSRLGAPDIRDKELRRLFNRILDRGARLTVMLDNCNSGSGARGLASGASMRGIDPDPRDVRDSADYGPRPERHGALVLSAAQDFDRAFETRDREGKMHGTFSWAWIQALRDAAAGESAAGTWARATARMRASAPFQEPVIAGLASVQAAPFLGARTDRRGNRTLIGVEQVKKDGTLLLHGGWANGLSIDTKLRDPATNARVVVTAMRGLGRSEARLDAGTTKSGALLEVVVWAPPPGQPLRVWISRMNGDIAAAARRLRAEASKAGLRWIDDPTETTPAYVMRWDRGAWQILGPRQARTIAEIPRGSSLFVQFPTKVPLATDDLSVVSRPEDADYLLAGRYVEGKLTYAWVRPFARGDERRKSPLPVRTRWVASAAALSDSVQRLQKIHAWLALQSPPGATSPYRLALKHNGAFVDNGTLIGDTRYELVLRPAKAAPHPRYVYAFAIDGNGAATLLFPRDGSVENLFGEPREIALDSVTIGPPYGIDTYVLLTTEEPLPNPWVLTWDGVRGGLQASRAPWSIERSFFESVPRRRH